MTTDDAAARVAALKAQANRMVEDWEGPQIGSKPSVIAVMKDLLAALRAAERERDQARADLKRIADRLCQEDEAAGGLATQQIDRLAHFILREIPGEPSQSQGAVDTAIRLLERATRLEALEQAARALDDTTQWPRDRTVACMTVPVDILRAVHDALANLVAPPGEGA